jgi:hypothetical protein
LEFLSKKGLIQEGECFYLGAGSAWAINYRFLPIPSQTTDLVVDNDNTKQVRKPKMSKKLLAFTRLMLQIWDPT